MSVFDKILTKPRETAGASSANRFDFQKNWALCYLLVLHEGGRDYVLILEHHEDVLVVFLTDPPPQVETFQIKTRTTGAWKLTALLKAKGTSKTSTMLGKLYGNCKVFGDDLASVNFVSNETYELDLAAGGSCGGRDKVCLHDLEDKVRGKINKKVMTEHGLAAEPKFTELAHLHVTTLSVHDHSDHAMGKVTAFIDKVKGTGGHYPVAAFYRALYAEIQRRSTNEWETTDFNELVKRRGMSRAEFQSFLDGLKEVRELNNVLAPAEARLTAEGMPFTDVMAIRSACRQHELDRMNLANKVAAQMHAVVKATQQSILDDGTKPTLREKLDAGEALLAARNIPGAHVYDAAYRKAAYLLGVYGY